ncbi:MAG TPA: hypothetical protein LFW21_00550 [Rickettsia endosymbiont of Pyrocoelia pectoralis]|nr:hypothetical protein [Rickettsia endosymbiont of Pyrocoelia pectoralis]
MQTKRINLLNNPEKESIIRYLDKNFYDMSSFADMVECHKSNSKLKDVGEDVSKDFGVTWKFFLYLAIGVKEAAYYLAGSFLEGFGVVKNEFLMYLTMAIGVKLKDSKTIQLVDNEPIPKDASKLADKCIAVIKQAENAVKGRNITYEEAIGWGKYLDKLVIHDSKHSFEKNIIDSSIKMTGTPFVEVIDTPVGVAGDHHHCEIS